MRERFRVPPPPRLSAVVAACLAIALPVVAFAAQQALRRYTEPIPFVLFFLVVALVSWSGGILAGITSVILSAVLGHAFLAGSASADRAAGALVGALVFVPVAIVIAALGALARAGFRERERTAETLEQALRVRDAFLSMASHELRTPMTSLQLVVQTVARRARERGAEVATELVERLPAIERQTRRLTRLVDDLLDVSRLSDGGVEPALEDLDAAEVVREVVARFAADVQHAGCTLSVDLEPGIRARWDRIRVERIVANLISNALKYGERRPIAVHVARRGRVAEIAVADQGIGIADADRERIFERFGRGRGVDGYAGFGLGLWIAREAAAALGGGISVDSAPGRGSRFVVTLPLAGPPPGATPARADR
jgi:two-component system, OmpR family, sensor kinase